MEVGDLTVDEALTALTEFLAEKPIPAGYYSFHQILEQADKNGLVLTKNTLADRLKKGIDNKTIDRLVSGGRVYYRMAIHD